MLTRRQYVPLPEWAIPLCYAIAALFAGLAVPRLEHRFLPQLTSSLNTAVGLTLLSSITSGMIALTGIVFSLALVMMQFSAVAYSPRLVLWVSRDPIIWHSIGIFTATFLYAIGAMAWIDRAGSGRVPVVSGWLVILLMLASVGMLVALIQRIGLLQINRMLAFTGNLGRQVIEDMYPPFETPSSTAGSHEFPSLAVVQTVGHSGAPQTLQGIDVGTLLALAIRSGGTAEVAVSVGDTLVSGTPMLRLQGGRDVVEDKIWKKAFRVGQERTFEQDPKYALRLLVDIAIKALSPAINDPTTAVQALDQIQDQLLRLGNRRLEVGAFRDAQGLLRVVVPLPTWDDFLRLAFDEIRLSGATSVQVMRRMRALIADLIATLPPERHRALEHHRKRLNITIARAFADEEDKFEASVEDRQGLGTARICR
ncbi:MAG TPA: DUF2254 domain-containing protein [Candidatus Binataceae bacterium]|nr:DUF2254 domain-containing protein [Candidatus Binataceae bacterium]